MNQLGRIDELPAEYRAALTSAGVTPLWPSLRDMLPPDRPVPVTRAAHWRFAQIRPLLIEAGELTPMEKAERRVLVLSDPGRGPNSMQATGSIYVGMQLLLPGEAAPAHRHTPSAARIIIEGEGGFTVVGGEKLPMNVGDIVLTPGGEWHDHGHDGDEPVIWLDALDIPVFASLEGSYANDGSPQAQANRPDAASVEYSTPGIVPSREWRSARSSYPMMRFPWKRTEEGLRRMAQYREHAPVIVDYVNPETGNDILPSLGFSALMLRRGEKLRPPIVSSSAVFHVVAGSGKTSVDGNVFEWKAKDVFSASVFADIEHEGLSEGAFLIQINDRPLQQKLGYYEERPRLPAS